MARPSTVVRHANPTSAAAEAVASLARLTAEIDGLQRQLDRMETELARSEERSRDLTDAKFVTYRTLIDSQADKVKLALEATEKAIDKAERATEKAIDKAESANDKRFQSVNEFRAQLGDLITRLATLERVDLLHTQTQQRINEVNENLQRQLDDQVKANLDMSNRMTAMEQYARGAAGNRSSLIAMIGAAAALITIVVIIANILSSRAG